jgi:hypothetical protein
MVERQAVDGAAKQRHSSQTDPASGRLRLRERDTTTFG